GTGDKASFAGARPKKPFDPSKGQWGALELAARVHQFEVGAEAIDAGLIDPSKSVREISAWAVGLNWSLTRNIKQVADYEHVSFKGGAASGDRESENVIFIRTQVSF
ncbi:MAG TPA: porin, partial [Vicinamibacteria bacterium]